MNKNFIVFLFAFAFLFTTFVSAQSSYVFKQGELINLKIPVYDDSNAPATNDISCTLNVLSPNQTSIVNGGSMQFNTGGIYNYTIPAMTELGEYSCSMSCTDGNVSGFSTFSFEVTPTGEYSNSSQSGVIIAQGVLVALFLAIGFSFSKEKWKLRGFFFMISVLMGLIMLNSIRVISGTSTTLDSMVSSGLIIGIVAVSFFAIYLLIIYTIELFKQIKSKKEAKWEISDRFN